ncbi:MAG: substrate-binding domain-containing protein [Candidatus Ruminococcus intestinipullorum]|nr:substrate-binding domain-containing protein [Candidatus Ruminococcus intestinipullorum]
MGKKNITFNDIAQYTNFSKTTISRYFNNPDSLTLENQEIIAKALQELNYKENKVAKVLANGKTEFVGVIIPNLYMHYYSEILNHLISSYEKFGYKFLVFSGNDNEEIEQKYIQELLAYKIEGLIVLSHTLPSKILSSYNIPVVAIEREDRHICSVNCDNYMGGVQATSVLIKNDCDILIHINSNVSPEVPSYQRIQGFLDTCRQQNIPHELILHDFYNDFESNQAVMNQLLDELIHKYGNKRKGIFMPNDTFTNIFLNLLFQRYRTLPDDFRIIGFDNSPISREAIIPFSTIGQQIEQIANSAMELLDSLMKEQRKRRPEPLKEPIHKVITPVLINRQTTLID